MTEPKTQKPKEQHQNPGAPHARAQRAEPREESSRTKAAAGAHEGRAARPQGEGLATQAKGVATGLAERATSLIGEQFSARSEKSSSDLRDLAEAMRLMSRQLESNFASPLIQRAADAIERTGELIKETDPKKIARNVEQFARKEPWLFVSGAVALGLIGARFLKSSSSRETVEVEAAVEDGGGKSKNGRRGTRAEPQA